MPRKPRMEYEGATYHVMSRGDHGEGIYADELDRALFLKTLGEACGRTGWLVHAYVLMSNHYHLLIETPQANLVSGMKWMQGTYTQRYNVRHRQRGHLFQGRYKAVPVDVEEDGCLARMADYIHLNPLRAGMIPVGDPLDCYAWSSFPVYTGKKAAAEWLRLDRVLESHEWAGDTSGCRAYVRYMEERIQGWYDECERRGMEGDWAKIREGWYMGSDEFKESLLDQLETVTDGKLESSFCGEALCEHDERAANSLLERGLQALEIAPKELEALPKGAVQKRVLAWLLKKHTVAQNGWIAQKLHMGHPGNIPKFVQMVDAAKRGDAYPLREKLVEVTKY